MSAPSYFVIPSLPRDVWYGYADKPELFEKSQLVCFVEQRHAHISPTFNAQYVADALNEKAAASAAAVPGPLEGELRGKLIRVGTFTVGSGDQAEEVTGYVVQCSREDIQGIKRLPIYREVTLRTAANAHGRDK